MFYDSMSDSLLTHDQGIPNRKGTLVSVYRVGVQNGKSDLLGQYQVISHFKEGLDGG